MQTWVSVVPEKDDVPYVGGRHGEKIAEDDRDRARNRKPRKGVHPPERSKEATSRLQAGIRQEQDGYRSGARQSRIPSWGAEKESRDGKTQTRARNHRASSLAGIL